MPNRCTRNIKHSSSPPSDNKTVQPTQLSTISSTNWNRTVELACTCQLHFYTTKLSHIFRTPKLMLHDLTTQRSTLIKQTYSICKLLPRLSDIACMWYYITRLVFPKDCRLIRFARNATFYNAAERIPSSTQRGSSPSSSNKERAARP